jgi:hypothetical protein
MEAAGAGRACSVGFDHQRTKEPSMNGVVTEGNGLIRGLSCLAAAAILLGACQEPGSSASGQPSAYEQNMRHDMTAERERRCCHRAARGNGN